jgi:hypothetical protein
VTRRRQDPNERKALQTMRNLRDKHGWHDEALLVDAAAVALGDCEVSKLTAQRTYDKHFKIREPN